MKSRTVHTLPRKARQPLVSFAFSRCENIHPLSAYYYDSDTNSAALSFGSSPHVGILMATLVNTVLFNRLEVMRRANVVSTGRLITAALTDASAIIESIDVTRLTGLPAEFASRHVSTVFARTYKVGQRVKLVLIGTGNVQALVVERGAQATPIAHPVRRLGEAGATQLSQVALDCRLPARVILAPGDHPLAAALATESVPMLYDGLPDAVVAASRCLKRALRSADEPIPDTTCVGMDIVR